MYNKFYIFLMLQFSLSAHQFEFTIAKISPTLKEQMINHNSWRKTCPVRISNLRYLSVSYWNFNGVTKTGKLIVHKDVSKKTIHVFSLLSTL